MKKIIILLLLLSIKVSAQSYTTSVLYETPNSQINVYIVSQGFTTSCMGEFETYVTNFLTYMWSQAPYNTNQTRFRIIRVEQPSATIASPAANFQFGNAPNLSAYLCHNASDTCEGATNQYQNSECAEDFKDRMDALSVTLPGFDSKSYVLAVFNNNYYTGGGGKYTFVTRFCNSPLMYRVALHEFSHTFGLLGDEYSSNTPILYGTDCLPILDGNGDPVHVNPQAFPLFHDRNVTDKTVTAQVPWNYLIGVDASIGLFQGANYDPINWYRPASSCLMQNLGSTTTFCHVCSDLLTERVQEHLCYATNTVSENFVSRHQYITHWRKASSLLTSSSSVGNTISVDFVSGNTVVLTPGFNAVAGSDFVAQIGDCTAIALHNTYRMGQQMSSSNISRMSDALLLSDDTAKMKTDPNPAAEKINVYLDNTLIRQISIATMEGKLIINKNIDNLSDFDVDVSNLPSGIYIISAVDEKGHQFTQKFVKK